MKLSTEQFWEAMCDPKFRRIDLHTGMIRDQILETDEPPEEVPTFMWSRIEHIRELLCLDELEKPWYRRKTTVRFWIVVSLSAIIASWVFLK